MAKAMTDVFSNKGYGRVTMAAANTLTFSQILFGTGLFDKTALVVHRVLWFPDPSTLREIVAATDTLHLALTTSNRLTAITDVSDPAIICNLSIIGVAAGTERFVRPLVQDFTMLPGGGLLVPANPLWCAIMSAGYAAAADTRVQLDFTFKELGDADYLELLQTLFPANIA